MLKLHFRCRFRQWILNYSSHGLMKNFIHVTINKFDWIDFKRLYQKRVFICKAGML